MSASKKPASQKDYPHPSRAVRRRTGLCLQLLGRQTPRCGRGTDWSGHQRSAQTFFAEFATSAQMTFARRDYATVIANTDYYLEIQTHVSRPPVVVMKPAQYRSCDDTRLGVGLDP